MNLKIRVVRSIKERVNGHLIHNRMIVLAARNRRQQCESGGTGRRARLRGVWFTPYGFKSRFSHHILLYLRWLEGAPYKRVIKVRVFVGVPRSFKYLPKKYYKNIEMEFPMPGRF